METETGVRKVEWTMCNQLITHENPKRFRQQTLRNPRKSHPSRNPEIRKEEDCETLLYPITPPSTKTETKTGFLQNDRVPFYT